MKQVDDGSLFVIPDARKFSPNDAGDDSPSIAEKRLLFRIQNMQRKLIELRQEKARILDYQSGKRAQESGAGKKQKGSIIVVSSRLPVTLMLDKETGKYHIKASSGGLVAALNGARNNLDFVWIGWPGEFIAEDKREEIRKDLLQEFNCIPVFLEKNVANRYYNGFCNDVLWPIFHYEPLPSFKMGNERKFEVALWEAYSSVNQKFAATIANVLEENDQVWIHDYQLMLVPRMLRRLKPKVAIGWFLHIPFPSSEIYRMLPVRKSIILGVLAADLVGFHTFDYARHFLSSVSRIIGSGCSPSPKGIQMKSGHFCSIGVFPIGIEPEHFLSIAKKKQTKERVQDLCKRFQGKLLLLGVDRLDYIKGMPHKLIAFEKLLAHYPQYRGRAVLLQISVPSRTQVEEYKKLAAQVNQLVGRINSVHGTLEYTPIHYIQRPVSTEELCALYAVAHTCVITSVRDGMNLISHEYIVMQNLPCDIRDGPGVLILSEFAGAAQSLSGAMRVNPWHTEELTSVMHHALSQERELRELNQKMLYRYVTTNTSAHWAKSFLDDLFSAAATGRLLRRTIKDNAKKRLPLTKLPQMYRSSRSRLLVFDYDGAIAGDEALSQLSGPSQMFLDHLNALSVDPRNTVILFSTRARKVVEKWFGGIQGVTLVAESGVFAGQNGSGSESIEWQFLCTAAERDTSWQGSVLPTMRYYADRTPGSYIEAKEHSLTWYFNESAEAFGQFQAKEMQAHLDEVLVNFAVEVLHKKKSVEVRALHSSKGQAIRKATLERKFGLVLCIGEDTGTDSMFAACADCVLENGKILTCLFGIDDARVDAKYILSDSAELKKLIKRLALI
eukprot:g1275.t1